MNNLKKKKIMNLAACLTLNVNHSLPYSLIMLYCK